MNEEVRRCVFQNTSSIQKRFDADVITARWSGCLIVLRKYNGLQSLEDVSGMKNVKRK